MAAPGSQRTRFSSAHRLRTQRQFDTVYESRVYRSAGPLKIYGTPNELEHPRLGLSVSTRVGNAVERNRIKRRLRTAFRLLSSDLPCYDLVIVVRKHEPLTWAEYESLLVRAARNLDRHWTDPKVSNA